MIEAGSVSYKLIVKLPTGESINITEATSALGWEEGENELAAKMSFEFADVKHNGKKLSSLIKLKCPVIINSSWSGGNGNVMTCIIEEAEQLESATEDKYSVTAYDILFNMQKSQDNIYFAKGKKTKTILESIFKSWKVPLKSYSGPNVKHGKVLYKAKTLGDIIRDLLLEAKKKGGAKAIVRSAGMKAEVVKVGSNATVYVFDEDNSIQTKKKMSTVDMVTRIKIVSSEKNDKKSKVLATVDGKTEYGIRQKIVTKSKSDSLKEAKKEAQEELKENGSVKKTLSLQAPDLPFMRKADMIYIRTGSMKGYYIIKSIQHNAAKCTMTMQVEAA